MTPQEKCTTLIEQHQSGERQAEKLRVELITLDAKILAVDDRLADPADIVSQQDQIEVERKLVQRQLAILQKRATDRLEPMYEALLEAERVYDDAMQEHQHTAREKARQLWNDNREQVTKLLLAVAHLSGSSKAKLTEVLGEALADKNNSNDHYDRSEAEAAAITFKLHEPTPKQPEAVSRVSAVIDAELGPGWRFSPPDWSDMQVAEDIFDAKGTSEQV